MTTGPCRLPANPSSTERLLTLSLLESLEAFGAHGTFDIVGDTSENYPDKPGKAGSASWGGIRYDHYPDIHKDADGGAVHCPELVQRILDGGHEITSHTYRHVLYGPKPLVYGGRQPFENLAEVTQDLRPLDELMRRDYGYAIRLSRPPHYVVAPKTALPATTRTHCSATSISRQASTAQAGCRLQSFDAEVDAMLCPMERALAQNPDCLCGQIIFQKDGYNMARRSPGCAGASETAGAAAAIRLPRSHCLGAAVSLPVCRPLARKPGLCAREGAAGGRLVHLLPRQYRPPGANSNPRGAVHVWPFGWEDWARGRIELVQTKTRVCRDVPCRHPYAAAIELALERGCMQQRDGRFFPDEPVSPEDFSGFCRALFAAGKREVRNLPSHMRRQSSFLPRSPGARHCKFKNRRNSHES